MIIGFYLVFCVILATEFWPSTKLVFYINILYLNPVSTSRIDWTSNHFFAVFPPIFSSSLATASERIDMLSFFDFQIFKIDQQAFNN